MLAAALLLGLSQAADSGVAWLEAARGDLLSYGLRRRAWELCGILGGALGMLFLGVLDDKHELRPAAKFAGQLATAGLVAASGVRISLFIPSTALHYAVMKGEMPLVALLVQRGADVNSRTKSGTTPLHTAVLYGRLEVAEYLIQKGADVNAKSPNGATPLGLAYAANYHTLGMLLRSYGGR